MQYRWISMTLTPLDQQDPRLRQICAVVAKSQLRDKQQQLEIDALLDFVHGVVNKTQRGIRRDPSRPNTVGLAANQVGIMKQIVVADMAIGRQGYTDIHVLVNPEILWISKALVNKPEGCVNFPEVWGVPERSRAIKIGAYDRSGNEVEMKLTGWPAVLMQHEIDHLSGRLFIDRLPDPRRAHLVRASELSEYRRGRGEWNHYVDVSQSVVKPTAN